MNYQLKVYAPKNNENAIVSHSLSLVMQMGVNATHVKNLIKGEAAIEYGWGGRVMDVKIQQNAQDQLKDSAAFKKDKISSVAIMPAPQLPQNPKTLKDTFDPKYSMFQQMKQTKEPGWKGDAGPGDAGPSGSGGDSVLKAGVTAGFQPQKTPEPGKNNKSESHNKDKLKAFLNRPTPTDKDRPTLNQTLGFETYKKNKEEDEWMNGAAAVINIVDQEKEEDKRWKQAALDIMEIPADIKNPF